MIKNLSLKVVTALTVLLLASSCGNAEQPPVVEDLTTRAPVVVWQTGPAGLEVPVSATDGPLETSPVPHSFSHSPQGAVLAAITGQAWMAGADDELWPEVAQYLLEPGLGRDQWSQARALVSVAGTVTNPPQFEAFKFTSYSDESAVVVLATRWPDGMLTAYPVQLSHGTGQWKVVIPPQDQAVDMKNITDSELANFVSLREDAS